MRSTGIVKKTEGNEAIVEIKRTSACGDNCANCSGCGNMSMNEIKAENKILAKCGDTVIVEMDTNKVLKAAFYAYIMPLLMLFLGYFLVFYITKTEIWGILGGISLMILTFVFLHLLDKNVKKEYIHKIVEIKKSI